MQLPALFVEYLVGGSVALFSWVLPLSWLFNIPLQSIPAAVYAGGLPILYLLGLVADNVGELALRAPKRLIRRTISRAYNIHELSFGTVEDALSNESGDFIEAYAVRRSRARVMRAAVGNSLIATGVAIFDSYAASPRFIEGSVGLALLVVAFLIIAWVRFERMRSTFVYRRADAAGHTVPVERSAGLGVHPPNLLYPKLPLYTTLATVGGLAGFAFARVFFAGTRRDVIATALLFSVLALSLAYELGYGLTLKKTIAFRRALSGLAGSAAEQPSAAVASDSPEN